VWEWEHGGNAPLLLDVRPARRFAAGHLPGAQNIPLGDLAGLLSELPRARRLVVCCACGEQCEAAAQLLRDHGYESVRALEGAFCVCRASRPG
jgi:rhodanese-related sulfurtransferase